MTDQDDTVIEIDLDAPPWWKSGVTLPKWYKQQALGPHSKHGGLYGIMFFIAFNAGGYFVIFESDTNPSAWHFITYFAFLGLALICTLCLLVVEPGIQPPNLEYVFRNGNMEYINDKFLQDPSFNGGFKKNRRMNAGIRTPLKNETEEVHEDDEDPDLIAKEYTFGVSIPTREIDGVECRWCYTCKIWRPPRTVHCSDCGFCIQHYDHHCGVIGTCVGKRNVRFFALLLCCGGAAALALFVAAVIRANNLRKADDMWKNWNWYFTVAGCVYTVMFAMLLGGAGTNYVFMSCINESMDSISGSLKRGKRCDCSTPWMSNLYMFWLQPLGKAFKRYGHPMAANRGYFTWQ
eukprot:m.694027 g.694027  ORF g.694027 m.694027 type:complete len:348 (+) comp22877_c0_seq1:382-1425(+)